MTPDDIRKLHASDQLQAASMDYAKVLGTMRTELIAQGFTPAAAEQIILLQMSAAYRMGPSSNGT